MKAPAGRLQRLPLDGEGGLKLQVRAAPHQPLVNVPPEAQRKGFVERVGVQGLGVALKGVAKGLGAGGNGRQRQRRRRQRRNNASEDV